MVAGGLVPERKHRATSAEGGAEHMRITLRACGAIAMATILAVGARSAWAQEAPAAGGTAAPAANAPPPDPTRGGTSRTTTSWEHRSRLRTPLGYTSVRESRRRGPGPSIRRRTGRR